MDARSRTFSVNGFLADFGDQTLKDNSGNSIVLRPQCFAVLRYFSENANRLITKDELMQTVWRGTAVTDDSLVQCIHEIRRALNDEKHVLLKTVPKHGYRLQLLRQDEDLAPEAAASLAVKSATGSGISRAIIAAGVVLVLASGAFAWWVFEGASRVDVNRRHSVAVLPFDNLGGDLEQRYFADGITDDLITDLTNLSGIFVVARNSTWAFRNRPVDAEQVARELGVRYVLVGSVRRDNDRVRINAQLIDAVAGHHLWAQRYDGTVRDLFPLQDKVISDIVSALVEELNQAPTAGVFENTITALAKNTSTASHIRVAGLSATDDGLGTNVFGLSGQDAASFEIVGGSLYLKAGATLNYKAKSSYSLTVDVDDSSVGGSPDASNTFTLTLTDANEPPIATKLN
jgi:TolB-like protein/DNA-binding winged helix-turn-helix (wHTH) protein